MLALLRGLETAALLPYNFDPRVDGQAKEARRLLATQSAYSKYYVDFETSGGTRLHRVGPTEQQQEDAIAWMAHPLRLLAISVETAGLLSSARSFGDDDEQAFQNGEDDCDSEEAVGGWSNMEKQLQGQSILQSDDWMETVRLAVKNLAARGVQLGKFVVKEVDDFAELGRIQQQAKYDAAGETGSTLVGGLQTLAQVAGDSYQALSGKSLIADEGGDKKAAKDGEKAKKANAFEGGSADDLPAYMNPLEKLPVEESEAGSADLTVSKKNVARGKAGLKVAGQAGAKLVGTRIWS